jgi:hypothetical protein
VETIVAIDHFGVVGDSDGYLNVYTIPHLDLVVRVHPRASRLPYSLSALAVAADQLFTGDTAGYVTVRVVRVTPRFSMEPPRTCRCHMSEITKIEPIDCGDHFATVGVDLAVRLWETESLSCVGTFGEGGLWDVEDAGGWRAAPVEEEEEEESGPGRGSDAMSRIDQVAGLARLGATQVARAIMAQKSTLRQPSMAKGLARTQPAPAPVKDGDFDWIGAYERMQAAMNAPPVPIPSPAEMAAKQEVKTKKRELPTMLQHSLDAKELLSRIAVLREKKVPTMESVFGQGANYAGNGKGRKKRPPVTFGPDG